MTDREQSGEPYDLIVLGTGNAGIAAADVAVKAGWRVAIVEARDVGGTCALRGCVPKKVLVAAAETLDAIARASSHHIQVGAPELDWAALIDRKQTFVDGVPEAFEQSLVKRGIDVLHGRAKLVGENEVEVDGNRHRTKHVVIATGSRPRPLPFDGSEHLITSDELLELRERPSSVVFVGAGVIALEFTHVLARAGARVTLLELAPRPLMRHDEDAVGEVVRATRALGADVLTEVSVQRVEKSGATFAISFDHHGEERTIEADVVINGAGRVAALDDLDLGAAGITYDRTVSVDAGLRSTENPAVWFAGDALPGRPQLSPVATYEGRIVGRNLVNGESNAPDYSAIPSVVFTVPSLATVGRTEADAREAGLDFDVRLNDMREWRSARTYAEDPSWAKVLVEKSTGKILGAHLVGHGAAETVHLFASAIEHGWTADALKSRVYAYPTFHSDAKYLV